MGSRVYGKSRAGSNGKTVPEVEVVPEVLVSTDEQERAKSGLQGCARIRNESEVVLRHWRDTSGTCEVSRDVRAIRDEFRAGLRRSRDCGAM